MKTAPSPTPSWPGRTAVGHVSLNLLCSIELLLHGLWVVFRMLMLYGVELLCGGGMSQGVVLGKQADLGVQGVQHGVERGLFRGR